MASPVTEKKDAAGASAANSSPLLTPAAWVQIGVLGLLFVLLHSYVLGILYQAGRNDPNWSHIFAIPFISGYMVYRQRERLKRCPTYLDYRGLGVFVFGLVMYGAGIHLNSTMIMGYGMVIELIGLAWFFLGAKVMSSLWLPIAYLGFGVRFTFIYTYISLVLQHVASFAGAVAINVLGIPLGVEADNTGVLLTIYHHGALINPPLNVEEACSGLRSLMALTAIAVAMAFVDRRPWPSRLLIIAAAVPTAVAVNVFRISVTGLSYPFQPELSRGDAHDFIGLLMLLPAMGLLMLVMKLCDRTWEVKPW